MSTLRDTQYGLENGFCILSIERITERRKETIENGRKRR